MTKSDFHFCLGVIFPHEGGFTDDPRDPAHLGGKSTNMGITQDTLSAWRGYEVTKQEVKELTKPEAVKIYKTWFWDGAKCEKLPRGINLCLFDFAINAGVPQAVKIIQRLVGAKVDGIIGKKTIGAIKAADQRQLLLDFAEVRIDFYKSCSTWDIHSGGWTDRTYNSRDIGLEMLDEEKLKGLVKEAVSETGLKGPSQSTVGETVKKAWRPGLTALAGGAFGLDHLNPELLNLEPWQAIVLASVVGVYFICRTAEKIAGVTK